MARAIAEARLQTQDTPEGAVLANTMALMTGHLEVCMSHMAVAALDAAMIAARAVTQPNQQQATDRPRRRPRAVDDVDGTEEAPASEDQAGGSRWVRTGAGRIRRIRD